jgi:peroxiredoxin/Tfp pilus assembly protein PilF
MTFRRRHVISNAAGLVLWMLAIGQSAHSGWAAPASTTATVASLTPAPDFELPTADGQTFGLSKHAGTVRVLFFVGNNGRFVPEALQATEKVVAASSPRAQEALLVCIVAINLDPSQFETFQNQFHLKWAFLLDRKEAVHRLYEVIAVPTTVIVNQRGELYGRFAGYSLSSGKEFRTLLRGCLGLPDLTADSGVTTATQQATRRVALGDVMVRRSMWVAALNNFQSALSLVPQMQAARWRAGFCFLRLGRVKEGREEFQRVLSADAASTAALIGLAWVKVLEGQTETARADLERLRPKVSGVAEYYEAWAAVHEATGAADEARQDREKADRLHGRSVLAPVSAPKKTKNPSK